MSITISDSGFIWKYKIYGSKSQNDTTKNQITLKALTWGEWVKALQTNRKAPGSNPTRHSARFREPTL